MFLFLAVLALAATVVVVLKVEELSKKMAAFLSIGCLAAAGLNLFAGKEGAVVLHHVMEEYAHFITVPLATVMIAGLSLFSVRTREDVKLGWFLFLALPVIGNFATTWALVAIVISLYPLIRHSYPRRWLLIMITSFVFPGNILALATLLADPPQAYLAIKSALAGKPLAFFYPFHKFWPFMLSSWVLFGLTLSRLGVEFGPISNLLAIRPASWIKAAYGCVIALSIGLSLMYLHGYQVTLALGTLCLAAGISSWWFGKQERHNTLHWAAETAAIFVAFFSVVGLARMGLHGISASNEGMVAIVVIMTVLADNAAAFAVGFEHFALQGGELQVHYNLFNAIVYGGLSPIGNGPQITAFLVILVSMKAVNPGKVFKTWFMEFWVFGPYLLLWTFAMPVIVAMKLAQGLLLFAQFALGILGISVSMQFMDMSSIFRRALDSPEHPKNKTALEGD